MPAYDVLKAALTLLVAPDPTTVSTPVFKPESLSPQDQADLQARVQQTRGWSPSSNQNVVGLGIAEKRTSLGSVGELALAVYVRKKQPVSILDPGERVPGSVDLPGLSDQVITDVNEIGAVQLEALSSMLRPVVCGYSIGRTINDQKITGTLGCVVSSRGDSNRRLLLSNSHVFAASGLGQPGDPICQPGPDDAGSATDVVAKLASWQPFNFTEAFDNHVDAALAEPVDPALFDPTIYDIGRPKGVGTAKIGDMVQKTGRTTGHTWGRVQDVDFHTSLQYPRPDGSGPGPVNFANLVLCSRYTAPGDSGSLVLDADGYAVGLHFCGTESVSIFSPIQYVLDTLNVDLVT